MSGQARILTKQTQPGTIGKVAAFLFGIAAYLAFFVTVLYAIGFIAGAIVPKTIDSGPVVPWGEAAVTNLLLMALFAVQHSVMARRQFKQWWTRYVPQSVERSIYVLFASLALILLFWQWRPMPDVVWQITDPQIAMAVMGLSFFGWFLVLTSSFLINHFELFGLRQVWARLLGRTLPVPTFHTPFLYKRVRHPIYLGFLLAFWAAPTMTAGHLLFAIGTTGYILIGIWLEERDLIALFGDQYRRYREQVSMLIPLPGRKASAPPATVKHPAE